MLFGPGLLLAGGATILMAMVDKAFEDMGMHWLGTAIKIALPLAGMALGVYFLETNAIVSWLFR
ncbi:hypothetical protein [Neobacillus drentensis]|uniref:hypothetical protein n=1 Tax=Neobacillus drentensis TaxID=220684 RepID=UPI002FFDFCDF